MPLRLQGQSIPSSGDQQALLEVIEEDYFTSPDNGDEEDDLDDDNSRMPGSAHSLEGAVM